MTAVTTLPASGLRRVLVILCVTEITSWGVLFYSFPVLAPGIEAATGCSRSARSPTRWPGSWWGGCWTGSGRGR
jgi:hypothetical protein